MDQKSPPAEGIVMKHSEIADAPAPTPAPAAPAWPEIRHSLKFPIPAGEATLAEVVLREPDVEALERIDELGMVEGQPLRVAQIRGIIAALSGLPDEAIKRMHKADFAALGEKVVPLLEAVA